MAKDILLEEKGDLKIVNGDFVVGDSDNQEIENLLIVTKGEFKEFPLVGGDISKILKSRGGQTAALKEIRYQLKNDGFDISDIKIEDDSINVNAERTT